MGSNVHSHGQRGHKPCAMILLIAFVVAIMGVMVVHKLREKRIFTLLVEEKSQELLTLHLLLQKEREFNEEARKKMKEMTNRVYTLRTQKLELYQKLSEMESTISSLKDERKVIELTFNKKKNEIKEENLRTRNSPKVVVLRNLIKMKDREIETLKFKLNKPDSVQSFGAKSQEKQSDSSSNTKISEEESQEHIPSIKPEKPKEEKAESKETQISHGEAQQKFGYTRAMGRSEDDQESPRHTSQKRVSQDENFNSMSKTESMPAIIMNRETKKFAEFKNEKMDFKIEKEAYGKDQLALYDKINQTVHSTYDDQSGDKENILRGIESNTNYENANQVSHSDEIEKQLHEQEMIEEKEIRSNEVKNEYDNEKENEVVIEEGEGEESEAENHEPEIDGDDIQRFSETEPEEEVEEIDF